MAQTGPDTDPNRAMIAITVMLAVLMIIIDKTVVNVSLPHMMGAFGATSDQITWVLTSYIVAEVVTIPMSGFLALRFGRKRVIFWSVTGFVVTSALCGQSTSLTEIIVFRTLQGAFGASVIPLSQSIMVDTFDESQRGRAMAVWGMGIMLGPVLGPTVGGYITDSLNWRWIFYVNVPVGILNVLMIQAFVLESVRHRIRVDLLGALVLAIGVGCLQTGLDRGNQDDWFNSPLIISLFVVAVIGIVWFVVRSVHRSDAVLDISILADRNLATGTFMMMVFGLALFGTVALQPIMLERLLGYPAETSGLLMAPRGLAAAVGMAIVSMLIGRISPRWLVFAGVCMAGAGSYAMTSYNLTLNAFWIVWPSVLQGLGMGMVFVPLSALAYQTIPKSATDEASSIFNLGRTVGSAIGISLAATVLTRTSQINWNVLGGHINPYNPAVEDWLRVQGLSMSDPLAVQVLGQELARQSTMLGFVDAFYFIAWSFAALAPLVLLLRSPARVNGSIPMH